MVSSCHCEHAQDRDFPRMPFVEAVGPFHQMPRHASGFLGLHLRLAYVEIVHVHIFEPSLTALVVDDYSAVPTVPRLSSRLTTSFACLS